MNKHNSKLYLTPRSAFMDVELEGFICASIDGGNGNEGEFSLFPSENIVVDPFFEDVI